MDIKPANVLLVEDDPGMRRLISAILSRSCGDFTYNVETATTLSGAVTALKERRFDNVLLDLGLPDSKGAETVRKIHSVTPEMSIVVLTGSADRETELAAKRFGADDYLVKDADMSRTLVQHIRYAIEHKRASEALERSYRNFKSIVHCAPDAMICVSGEGRILEFNGQAEKLFGSPRKYALGKRFLDLCISRDDRFRIYAELRKVQAGEQVNDVISSVAAGDQERIALCWSFGGMKSNGDSSAVIIATARQSIANADDPGGSRCGPPLVFNPDFDGTVDLVLNSLCAIIDGIDKVDKKATPETLGKLESSYDQRLGTIGKLPPEKTRAIERLIVGLMKSEKGKPSQTKGL